MTGGGGDVLVSGINVSGNTVYDSSAYGIEITNYTESTTVANNRVYGSDYGIYADDRGTTLAVSSTVTNNTVFSNSIGIYTTDDIIASQNVVFGQSGYGIESVNAYEVLGNTVYDNAQGMYVFSNGEAEPVANNTIFGNAGIGLESQYATFITGNTIYGNATGISLDSGATGPVSNNLIYENTLRGILTGGGTAPITNNTIYQPTGDAIDVRSNSTNVSISNNVLWVMAGYDISVDATSEKGFQSDYNDLYFTGTGAHRLVGRPDLYLADHLDSGTEPGPSQH